MPKANTRSPSYGVRRIAIAGHFLDETQTRLHTNLDANSLSYVSSPVERHQISEDEEGVTLKLPALTALQLFYDDVLSADPTRPVELTIAGRKIGVFYLRWLRGLPGNEYGDPVLLRFERQPARKEQLYNPNAWLSGLVPLASSPKGTGIQPRSIEVRRAIQSRPGLGPSSNAAQDQCMRWNRSCPARILRISIAIQF